MRQEKSTITHRSSSGHMEEMERNNMRDQQCGPSQGTFSEITSVRVSQMVDGLKSIEKSASSRSHDRFTGEMDSKSRGKTSSVQRYTFMTKMAKPVNHTNIFVGQE